MVLCTPEKKEKRKARKNDFSHDRCCSPTAMSRRVISPREEAQTKGIKFLTASFLSRVLRLPLYPGTSIKERACWNFLGTYFYFPPILPHVCITIYSSHVKNYLLNAVFLVWINMSIFCNILRGDVSTSLLPFLFPFSHQYFTKITCMRGEYLNIIGTYKQNW